MEAVSGGAAPQQLDGEVVLAGVTPWAQVRPDANLVEAPDARAAIELEHLRAARAGARELHQRRSPDCGHGAGARDLLCPRKAALDAEDPERGCVHVEPPQVEEERQLEDLQRGRLQVKLRQPGQKLQG